MVNLEGGSSTTVYNYVWNGPNNYVGTTQNNHIKNLSKGTYIVEVEAQGARGCSITQTYTITEPEPINIIENEIRPVTCTGSEDGLISVTVNGEMIISIETSFGKYYKKTRVVPHTL